MESPNLAVHLANREMPAPLHFLRSSDLLGHEFRETAMAAGDSRAPIGADGDLSDRERDVMDRIARGESVNQIAEALGVKPNAVSQARYRALRKGVGDPERAALGQLRDRSFAQAARRVLGAGAAIGEPEITLLRPPEDLRSGAIAPCAPGDVRYGAPPGRSVGSAWSDDARPFRAPRRSRPLTGLTNRLGPTLWASTQLVLLAGDEGAVTARRFLEAVVPEAWRIGTGLPAWEERQRASIQSLPGNSRRGIPFHFSARWPSLSGQPTREASSVVSFVTFSLGDWRGRGEAVTGPLFSLGLVELLPTRSGSDELYLRPTPKAAGLAERLGRAGASSLYPYSDDAWAAIRECLRDTHTAELARAVKALEIVRDSHSAQEFQAGIAMAFEQEMRPRRGRRDPDGEAPAAGVKSEASGQLARLRELGLVAIPNSRDLDLYRPITGGSVPVGDAMGPEALTARGRLLLADES